jgi:hypothetical protein
MSTAYVFTEVEISNDIKLYVDGNSKITVGNGTYENPTPNALSLPHISTCPGATKECIASCYIYGLQKNASEVYAKYCQNERVIHKVLARPEEYLNIVYNFSNWISENCKDGFRWHVSGDVMNADHAHWIANVAGHSPNVRHWIYTRSLWLVDILARPVNLVVNVSADVENYINAREAALTHGVRLCYLTRDGSFPDDLPEGSVIFPDYDLRGRDLTKPTDHLWWQGLSQEHKKMVCPADFFGQSEQHRCGPCTKCLVKD